MSPPGMGALVFITLVLGAWSLTLSQEQRAIERTVPLPDSLEIHLSSSVHEVLLRRNWEKLQKGMTFTQVEQLLDRPAKITEDMHDTSTSWYYGNRYVVFDTIKKTVRFWSKQ